MPKFEYNGVTKSTHEWAMEFGTTETTIRRRIAKGVPLDRSDVPAINEANDMNKRLVDLLKMASKFVTDENLSIQIAKATAPSDVPHRRAWMSVAAFWKCVEQSENYCWEWKSKFRGGYGHAAAGVRTPHGTTVIAHRGSYMLSVGPIPDGYEVDHLCFNGACVRPDHLEAVPPLVNQRRAHGTGRDERPDHCAHGHLMTDENSVPRLDARRPACRTCVNERSRRSAERRKAS